MRKLSLFLGAVLMTAALSGCGKQGDDAKDPTPTPLPTPTEQAAPTDGPDATPTDEPAPTEGPQDSGMEAGTVFDSIADFNYSAGQEGVWQYYFSGDNGETFDPCGGYHEYSGTLRGWHPWEGSYIGVGFNDDVEGFLELNTDGLSSNFSNQMGVLAFEAPAAGKYVITAKVWNPWSQSCGDFVFKKADGTVVLSMDISGIIDNYAYVTPTDVELKKGEMLYIFCNSTDSSWVSAYIACTMVYEPTDDSVYTVPEVPQREILGVEPDFGKAAAYNAFQEFDRDHADGANVPWIYASTMDGAEFTVAAEYRDTDYGADEWFSANGTGMGLVEYLEGDYLELNTPGSGAEIMALGFQAPADGIYTLNGYVFNPYGQSCEVFHASLNGEEIATIDIADYKSLPNEYSLEVAMKEGEVLYLYCPSTTEGGWVSAYISVFVNAQ